MKLWLKLIRNIPHLEDFPEGNIEDQIIISDITNTLKSSHLRRVSTPTYFGNLDYSIKSYRTDINKHKT